MARRGSRDESSRFEVTPGLIDAITGLLLGDPFGGFGQPGAEILFGSEPELLLGFAHGGETMPDIARSELPRDLRMQVLAIHGLRQTDRNVLHRSRPAAANVEHLAGGSRMFERDQEGASDVLHMHEIAPLLAVLEYHRTLAVQQTRGKNREHAGVRIRKRLTRPIDVEEPKRDSLDAVSGSDGERQALLHILGQCVNRCERRPLPFRRRHRKQRTSIAIERIIGLSAPSHAAFGVFNDVASLAAVEALAINTHRRCGDDTPHRAIDQRLKQRSGCEIVAADITLDLVHALADTDLGGEMNDAVDARQGAGEQIGIANIADEKFGLVPDIEFGRRAPMDLLDERIEDANAITASQGFPDHLATDETRAAGDENGLIHGSARRDL